jgi:hypothetical protein
VGLVCLCCLAQGCGHRAARVAPASKANPITVKGRISWSEHPDFSQVDVKAAAEWKSGSGGSSTTSVGVEQTKAVRVDTARSEAEYSLTLEMETAGLSSPLERAVSAAAARDLSELPQKTYRFASYTVSVTPPAGWTVSPTEIVVSTDTTNADFVLTRQESSAGAGP